MASSHTTSSPRLTSGAGSPTTLRRNVSVKDKLSVFKQRIFSGRAPSPECATTSGGNQEGEGKRKSFKKWFGNKPASAAVSTSGGGSSRETVTRQLSHDILSSTNSRSFDHDTAPAGPNNHHRHTGQASVGTTRKATSVYVSKTKQQQSNGASENINSWTTGPTVTSSATVGGAFPVSPAKAAAASSAVRQLTTPVPVPVHNTQRLCITPPLASLEDLQDYERKESALPASSAAAAAGTAAFPTPTSLTASSTSHEHEGATSPDGSLTATTTASNSIVLGPGASASATAATAAIDLIEIPPPMDSLASDKLSSGGVAPMTAITVMNGDDVIDCADVTAVVAEQPSASFLPAAVDDSPPASAAAGAATTDANGDCAMVSPPSLTALTLAGAGASDYDAESSTSDVTATSAAGGGVLGQRTPSEEQNETGRTMAEEEGGGPCAADEVVPPVEMSESDKARYKRSFVLTELVETERDYVRDLGTVIEGYMVEIKQMELPEDIQGKDKIVFANIAQIHEFHKNTFQKELEKCLDDYEAAAKAFVKFERRLGVYVIYCQNKPKSEYLMQQDQMEAFFNDIKVKLGHRLALSDLLIKPVQRIMKYQLLLKDILKYTERAGDSTEWYEKAMRVMHVVPKMCDDMMQVGRLQGFDGNINSQGKLVYQKTLQVSDNAPSLPFKPKDRHLFLFEQSVIIADSIQPKKEFCNVNYVFKSHIMVNKMALEPEQADDPLRFILKSSDPGASQQAFLMQAASLEEKQEIVANIKKLLDAQLDFLKALQQPIAHQKNLSSAADLEGGGGLHPDGGAGGGHGAGSGGGSFKKGKGPLISRITGMGKPSASKQVSAPAPTMGVPPGHHGAPPQAGGALSAPHSATTTASSVAPSPKSTRSRLFGGFGLKSKSSGGTAGGGGGPKSPVSPVGNNHK